MCSGHVGHAVPCVLPRAVTVSAAANGRSPGEKSARCGTARASPRCGEAGFGLGSAARRSVSERRPPVC